MHGQLLKFEHEHCKRLLLYQLDACAKECRSQWAKVVARERFVDGSLFIYVCHCVRCP